MHYLVFTLQKDFSLITRITLRLLLSSNLNHFYLQPLICVNRYSIMQSEIIVYLALVFPLALIQGSVLVGVIDDILRFFFYHTYIFLFVGDHSSDLDHLS